MALMQISFHSSVLEDTTNVSIILPRQLGTGTGDTSYPVLYLLHGLGDDHTTWSRQTSIEKYACDAGIAVVMPTTARDWYTDTYNGKKWRTYIGEELPVLCRDFFPWISTKREDTFIAGQSMGGYGTYALAMTYPEKYSAAAALSGAFQPYDGSISLPEEYWTGIFGPLDTYTGGVNDLFAVSEKLCAAGETPMPLYMWCGTEDFIYSHSIAMRDHLRRIGWKDFTYSERSGQHDWSYWDVEIQNILKWLPIRK